VGTRPAANERDFHENHLFSKRNSNSTGRLVRHRYNIRHRNNLQPWALQAYYSVVVVGTYTYYLYTCIIRTQFTMKRKRSRLIARARAYWSAGECRLYVIHRYLQAAAIQLIMHYTAYNLCEYI